MKSKKVLIVGLGLMGGSYAAALSAAGYEVGGLSDRQDALDYARRNGWIRHGMTSPDPKYIEGFDIVVSALYPRVFIDWVRDNGRHLRRGSILTDISGVKGCVVPRIQGMLAGRVEFVPAHPMAGREFSGIEYSDPGIFKGANFIITPTERNTPEGIAVVEDMAREMGFGKISSLSLERHDEMVGFLSQLTHCIAVALMTCKESRHLVDYTGDSFRDLTRIARINEDMWTELFLENKDELLSQMDLFMDRFGALRDAVRDSDEQTMKEMMRLSTLRRSWFDKKKEK